MNPSYIQKLDKLDRRFAELDKLLSDPKIISNTAEYTKFSKERASIAETMECYEAYKKVLSDISGNKELLKEKDAELKSMAQAELKTLEAEKSKLEDKLKILLLPKDHLDEKNILLEIRAGTGFRSFARETATALAGIFCNRGSWR